MPKASDVIRIALSQLGEHEASNGSSKFGIWYAEKVNDPEYRDAAWCDMFVSWCGERAGMSSKIGEFAWTVAHAKWFRSNGQWGTKPKVGAVVFFNWDAGPDNIDSIDHVGYVTKVRADGKIQTVEGNTSNMVAERVRDKANIVGYGYPAYSAAPVPEPERKAVHPVLKKGATGKAVKELQTALNHHGYGLAVDGKFGPKTDVAVRDFQRKNKLAVDGVAGPKTWGMVE